MSLEAFSIFFIELPSTQALRIGGLSGYEVPQRGAL